jgi:uncharacterized SAM-binding protein YcdF (DUF218 family)
MLVVLGKNWRGYPPRTRPAGWRLRLSLESKISALAAGHLFLSGRTDTILIASGKTAGRDWPSEADAMRRYLARRFPGIPETAVRLEDASLDTADNARLVAALLRASAPRSIALLTVGFHLPRSLRLFSTHGLAVERGVAAEDVVAQRSARHRAFIARYLASRRVRTERVKEALLRLLLVIDPTAAIPRLLTKRLRG